MTVTDIQMPLCDSKEWTAQLPIDPFFHRSITQRPNSWIIDVIPNLFCQDW